MPQPKDTLRSGLSLPRRIEAALPQGSPSISKVLEAGVNALPDLPMPALPSLPGTSAAGPRIREFIKSVESNLPAGIPSLDGAARAAEAATGKRMRVGLDIEETKVSIVPTYKVGL